MKKFRLSKFSWRTALPLMLFVVLGMFCKRTFEHSQPAHMLLRTPKSLAASFINTPKQETVVQPPVRAPLIEPSTPSWSDTHPSKPFAKNEMKNLREMLDGHLSHSRIGLEDDERDEKPEKESGARQSGDVPAVAAAPLLPAQASTSESIAFTTATVDPSEIAVTTATVGPIEIPDTSAEPQEEIVVPLVGPVQAGASPSAESPAAAEAPKSPEDEPLAIEGEEPQASDAAPPTDVEVPEAQAPEVPLDTPKENAAPRNIVEENLEESFETKKSSDNATKISLEIYKLLKKYKVKSIANIPCSKTNAWMPEVLGRLEMEDNEYKYYCLETSGAVMDETREKYHHLSGDLEFNVVNPERDNLPNVDVFITWDLATDMRPRRGWAMFKNVKNSGSKYLVTTSYPTFLNTPGLVGTVGKVNLRKAPYTFREPIKTVTRISSVEDEAKNLLFYNLKKVRDEL